MAITKETLEAILSDLTHKDADAIEIHPLMGLDKDNDPTMYYDEAESFEPIVDDEDADKELCWGVYVHIKGKGLSCLFDVVDKNSAEIAEHLLTKSLKYIKNPKGDLKGFHSRERTTACYNRLKAEGFEVDDLSYINDACDSLYVKSHRIYIPNSDNDDPGNEEYNTFFIQYEDEEVQESDGIHYKEIGQVVAFLNRLK